MDLDCFSCICQVDLKMEIVTPPGFLSDNQERIDSLVNELEATAHIAPPHRALTLCHLQASLSTTSMASGTISASTYKVVQNSIL